MFWHDGKKKIIILLKSIYITNDWFCIKDPRLCLFLNMWKEIINELNLEVYCIGIFRNPIAVCNSLRNRDLMSEEHALNLDCNIPSFCVGSTWFSKRFPKVKTQKKSCMNTWGTDNAWDLY